MKPTININSAILIVALAIFAAGRGWKQSGVPQALCEKARFTEAGAAQGAKSKDDQNDELHGSHSLQTQRRTLVNIASGTSEQLLAAYYRETIRTITNSGGNILSEWVANANADYSKITDFSFRYEWQENQGTASIYSFAGSNGQVRIVIFCYEGVQ